LDKAQLTQAATLDDFHNFLEAGMVAVHESFHQQNGVLE
jgi:hypothetical protein